MRKILVFNLMLLLLFTGCSVQQSDLESIIKEYHLSETYFTNLDGKNPDQLVTGLLEIQKKQLTEYRNKLLSPEINTALNNYEYKDLINFQNIKDEKIRNLLGEIFASGYQLVPSEGMYNLEVDYNRIFKDFSKYTSPQISDYLKIMATEYSKHLAGDAALLINLDELEKRIIETEEYLNQYPASPKIEEIKQLHSTYLVAYLLGLDNTPAFNYSDNRLKAEFLQNYEQVISQSKESQLAILLKEYLELLEKNNYKKTEQIIQFINTAAKQ